jgi:hypothetical protein
VDVAFLDKDIDRSPTQLLGLGLGDDLAALKAFDPATS